MTGLERIATERRRQEMIEGFDAKHDDDHVVDELAWMAAAYAAPEPIELVMDGSDPWPHGVDLDKRPRGHDGGIMPNSSVTLAERVHQLEKAGALCAAEIDRLLRMRR
jgi:hypothetical protein